MYFDINTILSVIKNKVLTSMNIIIQIYEVLCIFYKYKIKLCGDLKYNGCGVGWGDFIKHFALLQKCVQKGQIHKYAYAKD